jgi:hypothetical protein
MKLYIFPTGRALAVRALKEHLALDTYRSQQRRRVP